MFIISHLYEFHEGTKETMGNEIGTVFERRGQIPRNQVDSN